MENFRRLIEYLTSIRPGLISDLEELEPLLSACWSELDIIGDDSMRAYKLYKRMEDVVWNPPILSFTIERHGGAVLGSSRAELHRWEINIDKKTAHCMQGSYRQIRPRQPRLDVRPLAEKIAVMIIDHQDAEYLKWDKDGTVRVKIGKLLPPVGPKQTVASRRRRFREAIEQLLSTAGWRKVRPNVYFKSYENAKT